VSAGEHLAKNARSEGIEVRTCRMSKHYDVAAIASILSLIKREKVDVVSTHSGETASSQGLQEGFSRRRPSS